MKNLKSFLSRKTKGPSDRKAKDPNAPTPGLEQASFFFKALANLGGGPISVPGLQAVAQLVVQIIEVAQVSDCYNQSCESPSDIMYDFRKWEVTKPIALS
jgi:hypothetical protein